MKMNLKKSVIALFTCVCAGMRPRLQLEIGGAPIGSDKSTEAAAVPYPA
jgi:hypothetical protein